MMRNASGPSIGGTFAFDQNFRKSLEEVDPKAVIEAIRLDLWVIHHFRVLPTDHRFKSLTVNQKRLLLESWMNLPTSDQLKEYQYRTTEDPEITTKDEELFALAGYSPEQIARMKDQLEKGLSSK